MRFKDDDTLMCEVCYREISPFDDCGWEDYPLCSGCSARVYQEHTKKLCALCKKPLGEIDYCYNIEDEESLAHTTCVEKLPDDKQEYWSDDFG